jgi:hypothetical protein
MKCYVVIYKRYSSEATDTTDTIHVVARNIGHAWERAMAYIKKVSYGNREILSIEKVVNVEAIAK